MNDARNGPDPADVEAPEVPHARFVSGSAAVKSCVGWQSTQVRPAWDAVTNARLSPPCGP